MKRLIGILLAGFCLLTPLACFAGSRDVDVDIKAGAFMPSEDAMDEVYGEGTVVGGDLIFWSGRRGFSLGLGYMEQDGEPYTAGYVDSSSSEITITSLKLTGLFRIYNEAVERRVYPYFGMGALVCGVDEKVSFTSGYTTGSASASETAYGLLGLAGINIILSDKVSLFVEAELSSADFENQLGEDVDVGGLTIFTGIRF